ncbi:Ribonuclease H-like superfamily [Sesbania bispinosa]|nr:Ribonuclease H-like superfamily [Sesbania bispinosa]
MANLKCLGWSPPPPGFFKLNTDGSVVEWSNKAACGGVIKDHWGKFIEGFSARVCSTSPLQTELQGLLYGLQMAKRIGGRDYW